MVLYIDPGTGSMLFALAMSLAATIYFLLQKVLFQMKLVLKGGKIDKSIGRVEDLPFVIFTDDKRYWEMFKPICEEFERRKRKLVYWTCSEDDPGLKAEYEYVKAECIGDIYKASVRLNRMKAGICITTTPGLDVYQWKRSKDTGWYIHMMHGAGDAATYKMLGLDFFDAVLVSGRHQEEEIRRVEQVRGLPEKEVQIVGESHMDSLRGRLNSMKREENDKITVLLAPSWGESAILSRYGNRIIEALLKTGYRIIVRPHPQTVVSEKDILDKLMAEYPESEDFIWNFDNDNFDVLNRSDIMISDFSSVIWDYTLVFDKPVIFTDVTYDLSQYDLAWLGEKERWEMRVLPKVGLPLDVEALSDMKKLIDQALVSDQLQAGRESVREEAWGNIGKSAVKVADYMIQKYDLMYPKQDHIPVTAVAE